LQMLKDGFESVHHSPIRGLILKRQGESVFSIEHVCVSE
jgi:hypothetical protein